MKTIYYRSLSHNRFLSVIFFSFFFFFTVDGLKIHTYCICASCMHHITSKAHVEHIYVPEGICTHNADHKRLTVSSRVFASSLVLCFHYSLSSPHTCDKSSPCMFNNHHFFCFSPCCKQQVKLFWLLFMDIIWNLPTESLQCHSFPFHSL